MFLVRTLKQYTKVKYSLIQKLQKTDGYQLSKAILLDESSEFNAKPELEIYADDSKMFTWISFEGVLIENSIILFNV